MLSPYRQPLNSPQPYAPNIQMQPIPDVEPLPTPPNQQTQRPAVPTPVPEADLGEPEKSSGPEIPAAITPETPHPDPLEFDIQSTTRQQVGQPITLTLTVRNPTQQPIDNVIVECDFDEGLVFPGSTERKVKQSLGRIGARDKREVALTLTTNRAGQLCCRFIVTSNGNEITRKTMCVDAIAAESLRMSPQRRRPW